jgi:acyl-coenzyme A thioesterase PaaI-like protein
MCIDLAESIHVGGVFMIESENDIQKLLKKNQCLPRSIQTWARSKSLGKYVKFVGTSGVIFEKIDTGSVICYVENKTPHQNHIGGLHAMVLALAAETATGFAAGVHLPEDKILLLRDMTIKFLKQNHGGIRAHATLNEEQIHLLQTKSKGFMTITPKLTDDRGRETLHCELTWAWVKKK